MRSQLLLGGVSAIAFSLLVSGSAFGSTTEGPSCDATCEEYYAAVVDGKEKDTEYKNQSMSYQYVLDYCGSPPTNGGSKPSNTSKTCGF